MGPRTPAAGGRGRYETLEHRYLLAGMTEVPLVGGVSDSMARISVRTDEAAAVVVEYSTDPSLSSSSFSVAHTTSAAQDFTSIIPLDNLQALTTYYYRVLVDGAAQQNDSFPSFSTFPTPGTAASFTFGVAADIGIVGGASVGAAPAYEQIALDSASFLLQIGDLDHSDPQTLADMRQMHRDVRDPGNAHGADFSEHILTQMPLFHVWDDHDFGRNDANKTFPGRADALQAFQEYYPTPELANPDNGIWHSFRYGQVEFFMLDTRSQRDTNRSPDNADKSMLDGDNIPNGQKDWFKQGLLNSTAEWKFVISSVTFNPTARPTSSDHWRAFTTERDELRDFIESNNIQNVIVLSADIHTGGGIDDGTNSGMGLPEMTVGHTNLGRGNSTKTGTWSEGVSSGRTPGGYATVTVDGQTHEVTLEAKSYDGTLLHNLTLTSEPAPDATAEHFYYSTDAAGTVTNSDSSTLTFDDSDIVQLTVQPNGDFVHEIYLDGSDVGLTRGGEDIDGFTILDDGSVVLSVSGIGWVKPMYTNPGAGTGANLRADRTDLLMFTPTSLGSTTTGSWSLLLDGDSIELNDRNENIIALGHLPDGDLLISTLRNFDALGMTGTGSDVLRYDLNSGDLSIYLDGSDVGMTRGRHIIDALSVDDDGQTFHLSPRGQHSLGGISSRDEDVSLFQATGLGPDTTGSFPGVLTLDGSLFGLADFEVDGFGLLANGKSASTSLAALDAAAVDAYYREATSYQRWSRRPSSDDD